MKEISGATAFLVLLAANSPAQEPTGQVQTNTIQTPSVTLEPASESGTDGRRFGVGLMLGEPTGASLKYWLTDKAALDAGVGWSFSDQDDFHIHADYLYHLFDLIPVDQGRLPVYFGGGPRVKFRENRDNLFGIRAVAGLAYLFENQPIDIFLEAGPIFDVTPDFEVKFTAAIGARYWF
jgi:hypothetical protein